MAKSTIIKDLANSNVDLNISLKRARVLLSNFNEEKILNWVKNELEGYTIKDSLPEYRMGKGMIEATFFIGDTQYTNVRVPVPASFRDKLEKYHILQSVSALQEALKNKDCKISVPIPPEFYSILQEQTNIDSVISAKVAVDKIRVMDIFSKVESRLLDIFLILEKEFGSLDELDIDMTNKNEKQIEQIKEQINIYIFNDNSIKVGNENKIKGNLLSSCEVKE